MSSIIPDHLDGVNQARKARGNGGNSPRLSHPIVLTGEEENRTGHLRTVVWSKCLKIWRRKQEPDMSPSRACTPGVLHARTPQGSPPELGSCTRGTSEHWRPAQKCIQYKATLDQNWDWIAHAIFSVAAIEVFSSSYWGLNSPGQSGGCS